MILVAEARAYEISQLLIQPITSSTIAECSHPETGLNYWVRKLPPSTEQVLEQPAQSDVIGIRRLVAGLLQIR